MTQCSECRHDGNDQVCAGCLGHKSWEPKVDVDHSADHAQVLHHLLIDHLRARLGADDQADADQLLELLEQRLAEKSHFGTPAVIILREDEPPNVHELKDGEDLQQHAMQLAGDDGITEVIAVHILGRAEVPEPTPVWRAA